MALGFKNQKSGGMGFDPQAADPSNPKAGDIFMSDGTSRAAGLWRYSGTDWVQVGSGVGSPSIYGIFDAEDKSTTGFTNVTVSATAPLAGEQSYSISTFPASFPSVSVQDRNRNKENSVRFHYSLTSGSFKVLVKDQAANILEELTISETGTAKPSTLTFFIGASETSVQFHLEDVSSATGLKIDDVVFDDDPFVYKNLVETVSVRGTGNGGTSLTANVTDIDFTEVSDDYGAWDGSSYSVQNPNSIIEIKFGLKFTGSFSSTIGLYKNGTLYKNLISGVSTSQPVGSFISEKGEFANTDSLSIRVGTGLTLSNDTTNHYININEQWETEHVVTPAKSSTTTTNTLASTISTNSTTDIADLKFTGLIIGQWYMLNVQGHLTSQSTTGAASLTIQHDSSTLGRIYHQGGNSTQHGAGTTSFFQATATTVTFDWSRQGGSTQTLLGGVGKAGTFAELTNVTAQFLGVCKTSCL
jgi:hypothetical protein